MKAGRGCGRGKEECGEKHDERCTGPDCKEWMLLYKKRDWKECGRLMLMLIKEAEGQIVLKQEIR
jgi:hypothetical protein